METSHDLVGLPLYRCDDARAIDAAAIAGGTPAFELMTRAGTAAFACLRQRWPHGQRLGVLCGAGNNGGDGYVVARLARAVGMDVRLAALAPAGPEPAKRAAAEWVAAGGRIEAPDSLAWLGDCDVLIDALFGIGLSRGAVGEGARLIDAINASDVPVLALDVPSGLDADHGRAQGACVRATRTLSFITAKRGLYTGRARDWCGVLDVADLDVAATAFAQRAPCAQRFTPEALRRWLPPRARAAHKGAHGHVLAIGGDHGYAGAIRLCAEGALRVGAGLVSVGTRAEHVAAMLVARPEAMVQAVEDADALRAFAARADVLALGPGLGQSAWGRECWETALTLDRPLVLDADALNLLARAPRALSDAVLTPHPGEAARLLETSVAQIEADRFAAVEALAARYASVVVLKGAGTLVAGPRRLTAVIDAGNPGMASGGMGDVLTGVIAGLRAQGLDAFDAACAGALLHAAAGDAAAQEGGERGMLASDLFSYLRRGANPA